MAWIGGVRQARYIPDLFRKARDHRLTLFEVDFFQLVVRPERNAPFLNQPAKSGIPFIGLLMKGLGQNILLQVVLALFRIGKIAVAPVEAPRQQQQIPKPVAIFLEILFRREHVHVRRVLVWNHVLDVVALRARACQVCMRRFCSLPSTGRAPGSCTRPEILAPRNPLTSVFEKSIISAPPNCGLDASGELFGISMRETNE
jgi:hypothetical protein